MNAYAISKSLGIESFQAPKKVSAPPPLETAYEPFLVHPYSPGIGKVGVHQGGELEGQFNASQEALKQATSAYTNGLVINLDVLQAQDQLLEAKLALQNEHSNYAGYFLNLARVSGALKGVIKASGEAKCG